MNFLIISDTKLKVTISESECRKYDIDPTRGDFYTNEIKNAVKKILEVAEKECGFKVGSEKILVQLYPMPDGSGELFITKLVNLPWREREIVKECDTLTTYQKESRVFKFDERDSVVRALSILHDDTVCDIYRTFDDEYFIEIKDDNIRGMSRSDILTEYAARLDRLPMYLSPEHAELIAEGNGIEWAKRQISDET